MTNVYEQASVQTFQAHVDIILDFSRFAFEYVKGFPCVRGGKEAIFVPVPTRDNLQSGGVFLPR